MEDRQILTRIDQFVEEEEGLRQQAQEQHGLNEDQTARLRGLEVALDQCWDLLQQRRARREFGLDPDRAQARDATTVERYDPDWKVEDRAELRRPDE
jgi:hypothetical protein